MSDTPRHEGHEGHGGHDQPSPNLSLIINLTGKPEYVLNEQQLRRVGDE